MKPPLPPGRKRGVGKPSVATRFTDFLRQSGEQVLAARRHPMLRMRPIQLDLDSLQSVGGPLMLGFAFLGLGLRRRRRARG